MVGFGIGGKLRLKSHGFFEPSDPQPMKHRRKMRHRLIQLRRARLQEPLHQGTRRLDQNAGWRARRIALNHATHRVWCAFHSVN